MKLQRKWHVAGLALSGVSAAFVQYAAGGSAPPWSLRVAAILTLIAAVLTNLERALFPERKTKPMFPPPVPPEASQR